jgi:hypothetical protein
LAAKFKIQGFASKRLSCFLLLQCDPTFCEKMRPTFSKLCPNIAQNGALLNKNFFPKKLLIKSWEFNDKKWPKSIAYLSVFWAIKKCALIIWAIKKMRPNHAPK